MCGETKKRNIIISDEGFGIKSNKCTYITKIKIILYNPTQREKIRPTSVDAEVEGSKPSRHPR